MSDLTTRYFRHFALLIKELEINQKTGKMTCLAEDGRQCEIFFKSGQLFHAATVGQVGEEAIYEMLSWNSGRLSFAEALTTTEHSIDPHQLSGIHQTIALFQTRGVFSRAFTSNLPAIETFKQPEAKSSDHFLQDVIKPVEWNFNQSDLAKINPPKPASQPALVIPGIELNVREEVEHIALEPVTIEFVATSPLIKPQPPKPSPELLDLQLPKPAPLVEENLTEGFFLLPGQQVEPTMKLNRFRLADLVRKIIDRWPNNYLYLLIGNVDNSAGLLLFENGKLTTVRYVSGNESLRAQAAYNQLEAMVANHPSEVNIYQTDVKLLTANRTLLGGFSLIAGALAHTLDVRALMQEQTNKQATVALRLYNKSTIAFHFLYRGESLGSYQVKGNRLERGGDITPLLRDSTTRLDLLELASPEMIEIEMPQRLLPAQSVALTEATSSILQAFALISGQEKILTSTQKLLNEAATLFPCLQRVGVGIISERLTVSWTVDQVQAFVNQIEAQNAFNFLLTALLGQYQELLGTQTAREIARRAVQSRNIDLKKEGLVINCLA